MDTFKERFKNTAFIRFYTFMKIPLIWWIRPSLIEVSKERTILEIKLQRRTKNHLGAMYFGALAIGAEVTIAVKALKAIYDSKEKVDFVFKDFKADFLKRAEGDVHFICDQGTQVEALVKKCIESGQRESQTFESYAMVKNSQVRNQEYDKEQQVAKTFRDIMPSRINRGAGPLVGEISDLTVSFIMTFLTRILKIII